MSDLSAEIQDLISKTLPEATANEIKTFIENAAKTACELAYALQAQGELQAVVLEQGGEIERLKAFEAREKSILAAEEEVAIQIDNVREKGRNLKVRELEIKFEAAQEWNTNMLSLVDKVFGHPSVTVSATRAVPTGVDQHGNYMSNDIVTETTQTTEGKE